MGLSRRQIHQGVQDGRNRAAGAGRIGHRGGTGLYALPGPWRNSRRQRCTSFPGAGQRRWDEGRVAHLERKIGQQALHT